MARIELPNGKTAEVVMYMAEFRKLWKDGDIQKLSALSGEGGDLGDTYPLLAQAVVAWDLTDKDGKPLDPAEPASYDRIEPPTFMKLVAGVAQYISGQGSKN